MAEIEEVIEKFICPDCESEVTGIAHPKEDLCFTIYCQKCKRYLLEDEVIATGKQITVDKEGNIDNIDEGNK